MYLQSEISFHAIFYVYAKWFETGFEDEESCKLEMPPLKFKCKQLKVKILYWDNKRGVQMLVKN
jgi:hypothetical protein